MDDELLPIGEVSRRSGLTVSALRFYDREGVLPAAHVDPVTGYRRYDLAQVRQARLLAGMRRVQLPVAEMVAVLEAGSDLETVRDLLDGHVQRLERGVELARAEVARLEALVGQERAVVEVATQDLADALRDVRYAVSRDPAYPALAAVLLEQVGTELRAVATDRYRLALAVSGCVVAHPDADSAATVTPATGGVRTLLPEESLERLLAFVVGGERVRLTLGPDTLRAELLGDGAGQRELELATVHAEFPDYQVLLGPDVVGSGPATDLRELAWLPDPDGAESALTPAEAYQGDTVALPGGLVVSRPFLQDALRGVGRGGQLTLPETVGPLIMADATGSRLALLMPIVYPS